MFLCGSSSPARKTVQVPVDLVDREQELQHPGRPVPMYGGDTPSGYLRVMRNFTDKWDGTIPPIQNRPAVRRSSLAASSSDM